MKTENIDIKEKAKMLVETLSQGDGGFVYFEDMLNIFGDDASILKSKMDNLVLLLNNMNSNDYAKFEDLDFETEIWNMI